MPPLSHPLRSLVVALAGWINQQQREVIDYLQTENRVLREQLGTSRLRFTDDQRVRLAAKAKHLRRRVLQEIGTVARQYCDQHKIVDARVAPGDPAADARRPPDGRGAAVGPVRTYRRVLRDSRPTPSTGRPRSFRSTLPPG